jgi:hypothetical protein
MVMLPHRCAESTCDRRYDRLVVGPNAGIGERQGYAGQLEDLWHELQRTLRRLDSLAARELAEPALDELSRLRYSLHRLGEQMVGMTPTPGAEQAHEELADALEDARDATAEVAEAIEVGGWETAEPLVYEWRGALFRLRLARRTPQAARPEPEPEASKSSDVAAPLAAFALTAVGAAAFTGGAIFSAWPLWAAGMIAVVAGLLVYRP